MKTIEEIADEMFDTAEDRDQETRRNPVTGDRWIPGLDPLRPQKQTGIKRLRARAWFATQKPDDVPDLPINYDEREKMKSGGVQHILAWYARSLEARNYEVDGHPDFEIYARGVMASEYAPDFIKNDPALRRRFTPRSLNGLGRGLYWST